MADDPDLIIRLEARSAIQAETIAAMKSALDRFEAVSKGLPSKLEALVQRLKALEERATTQGEAIQRLLAAKPEPTP